MPVKAAAVIIGVIRWSGSSRADTGHWCHSGKESDKMAKIGKQEDGSYIVYYEIPMPGQAQDGDAVDSREELIRHARSKGYVIRHVKFGFRRILAVEVPVEEEVYRLIYRDEMKAQRETMKDGRCRIPDGRDGLMRCPMYTPNPDYDEAKNPGVPKNLRNDCVNCPYYSFDTPNYRRAVFSDLAQTDEDGNETPFEIGTGMMPEADRYERAVKDVLDFVAGQYPEKLEEFRLRLDEWNRNEIAKKTGRNTSTIYKQAKGLREDLLNLLESLVYLDIDTDRYRR